MMADLEWAKRHRHRERRDGRPLLQRTAQSVIRERMPPGAAEMPHRHLHTQPFFQRPAASQTIGLAGQERTPVPGHCQHLPAGMAYPVFNQGKDDVHFPAIAKPPSHGGRAPGARSKVLPA
ncbi:hypothetical protein N8I74_09550 [Chitiniphilus purpureus]|uniref:Uncharacterized protein n=1 Tax=Chitiniphilus purpureus TaxID=2981137 RepID=A0ABY6DUP2_9NEIS|nr:hypothetical protein [Chitiniphilus sp. CD1]UXY17231.1 hypothetical protein N8I74_09550 [Chitiniphilus sp. CD1]